MSHPEGAPPSGPVGQTSERPPVVVKKYANRRLYNTETSSYITLDSLAGMIRQSRDFVVYDAKSGEDITRSVLTQIIVEEESKGRAMLPTNFLRQIIGFYGDSLQQFIPSYLEQAMTSFALQQQQMRDAMQQTMGNFFPGMGDFSRQNMAMMERAMSFFAPFYRPGSAPQVAPTPTPAPAPSAAPPLPNGFAEIETMRREIERLHQQLAQALHAVAPVAPPQGEPPHDAAPHEQSPRHDASQADAPFAEHGNEEADRTPPEHGGE